jgi:uncharacterized protein (TIGR03118 family)
MKNWSGLFAGVMLLTAAAVSRAQNHYLQLNLISDLPDVAILQDTNLTNAWGIAYGPNTPFWVSDNGSGLATLYQITNDPATGLPDVQKLGLQVVIPGDGSVTGQIFNDVGGFNGDAFLFVSEDGTISGWRNALGANAETLVPGITNNVYKGVTLSHDTNGPVLLAANFRQGSVDVYNTNSILIGQFHDPAAPADYAPFGIQSIEGMIFVTFAKQDPRKHDDVAGPGNGLIDVYDPVAHTFTRFVTGAGAGGTLRQINSPWGVALAPDTFGKHAGELLVGNFGSGTIMGFDAGGKFQGLLKGKKGAIKIDGLWGLKFGNGTKAGVPDILYFSAGPNGESDGLFGSLQVAGR